MDFDVFSGGDVEFVAGQEAAFNVNFLAVQDDVVAGGDFIAVDDIVHDVDIAVFGVHDDAVFRKDGGTVERDAVFALGGDVQAIDFDEALERHIVATDRQIMAAGDVGGFHFFGGSVSADLDGAIDFVIAFAGFGEDGDVVGQRDVAVDIDILGEDVAVEDGVATENRQIGGELPFNQIFLFVQIPISTIRYIIKV